MVEIQDRVAIPGITVECSDRYLLVRSDLPLAVISTAPAGAEHRQARSILNITVAAGFSECGDPELEVERVAVDASAAEPVVGLLTAVPVRRAVIAEESDGQRRVVVIATVGIGNASRPGEQLWRERTEGTINIISLVDADLSPTALAECLAITVEAKALAVYEAGVRTHDGAPATGTNTDAVVVAATQRGSRERYAGAVMPVGFLLGRAVRRAVVEGLAPAPAS